MSNDPSIPGTGISVVTDKLWSLRVFFQLHDAHVNESKHNNGVWSNDQLTVRPVPLSPLASVTYHSGKEIRIYYLDAHHIIHEFCYTEGKGWYQGAINKMEAKATPSSGLAAVVYDDDKGGVHLRVYYQESGSNNILDLANDGSWKKGDLHVTGGLGGTYLAAVAYKFQKQQQIRVYYQAQDTSLKEQAHNNSGWHAGSFNPGKAAGRTPLAALAFGNVELQVYWRDLQGHVVFSRNTGSWVPATAVKGLGPTHNFAVLEWENGKRLRLYYQGYAGFVAEYCSDDSGHTWFPGKSPLKA